MARHFGTHTWSTDTFIRGLALLDQQQSMDLGHIHLQIEDDLQEMERELQALEELLEITQ